MDYLGFVDQVLSDFFFYFDKNPLGKVLDRLTEIQDLPFEEGRVATLSLRLAALIDPSRDEEMEQVCGDFARLRHEGHFHAKAMFIDHDRLGREIWTGMVIMDDAGKPCDIYYADPFEPECPDGFARIAGYMKAEEQDTADFLLEARVEAFLNHLDAQEQVAA